MFAIQKCTDQGILILVWTNNNIALRSYRNLRLNGRRLFSKIVVLKSWQYHGSEYKSETRCHYYLPRKSIHFNLSLRMEA